MDLFECVETLPKKIQDILKSFDENADAYRELKRIVEELEQHGFTFDYYLDAEPYNLRKIS